MKSKKPYRPPGISQILKNSGCGNPFLRTKAKNYPNSLIAAEFIHTNSFSDLLSTNNQVIVGTRGTGKTMLLRMLCPSVFRMRPDVLLMQSQSEIIYVGFWIPFELRWMVQLSKQKPEVGMQDFEFVFNCKAFSSLVCEMVYLIDILVKENPVAAARIKHEILQYAARISGLEISEHSHIDQFLDDFEIHFISARARNFGNLSGLRSMSCGLLEPCEVLTKYCSRKLAEFTEKSIFWMACFDEAEYLAEDQMLLLNTLMRSEREAMSIKIATLPSHYSTLLTLKENVSIKSGGHDFSFVHIDFPSESSEYLRLCDELVSQRLRSIALFENLKPSDISLKKFLGSANDHTLLSLYTFYTRQTREDLECDVISMLIDRNGDPAYEPHRKNVDRYIPIVAYKRLVKLHSVGRTFGVVNSGAERIKKITDGNFREFLRVMAHLYRAAQRQDLTPKRQHEAISDYVNQRGKEVLGIREVGLKLHGFIEVIRSGVRADFYRNELAEVGNLVQTRDYINDFPDIFEMVKQGVAAGYFLLSPEKAEKPIGEDTFFEIASCLWVLFQVYPRRQLLSKIKKSKHLLNRSEDTLPLFNYCGDELDSSDDS